jgi:hypothetical protein
MLWFHIPELPKDVENLEFMVQDEENFDLLDEPMIIPLAGRSGMSRLDWRTSGIPLEMDKTYHWFLSIICNAERPSRNPSIDAWIQRVPLSPAIANALTTATERERIELYINDGVWHDALTHLAELRCQLPNDTDLTEEWLTLLDSIGVASDMSAAPIAQCPNVS